MPHPRPHSKPSRANLLSRRSLCAAQKRRWNRGGTSGEVSRLGKLVSHARRLEIKEIGLRHSQQVGDILPLVRYLIVFLDRQQHMGGASAIGDEDRPFAGGALRSAGVLIELPAG